MSELPPPDIAYECPQLVSVGDLRIYVVGFTHEDTDVEVLARSGEEHFRFYIPKSSRVVRDFWKNIGVNNVLKLQAGAYEDSRGGCGPYSLMGMAIGEDYPTPGMPPEENESVEEAEPKQAGTKVLISVRLEDMKEAAHV